MGFSNEEQRTSKIWERGERSKSESQSASMEEFPGNRGKIGAYKIPVSRENRQQSNTVVRREYSSTGIPGEVIDQLVEETEKQLAYHNDQVKALELRLQELNQLSNNIKDKEDRE